MMADSFTDRLSDYLDALNGDDEMSAADKRAVETHLAACASCRTTLAELREVAARAASLPSTPPAADLWAGIAARLDSTATVRPFEKRRPRQFSFTLPQLVAAGLALMVLSGGMVWIARRGDPRTNLPSVIAERAPESAPPAAGDEPPSIVRTNLSDSRYDAAISDLEKTLDAGRNRLDPETVRILEANLLAIDRAIDQSRKALRDDPSNVYLNNHFVEFRKRKLALLRRATALTVDDQTGGSN
jgi:anti-sigma factor RsiW